MPKRNKPDITHVRGITVPLDEDGKFTNVPITHNEMDDIYIFYTPQGRLIQCESYDEAYAKWLLTRGD